MPAVLLDDREFLTLLEKLDFEHASLNLVPPPPVAGTEAVRRPTPTRSVPRAPMIKTLLDDPEFVAELDKLDIPETVPGRRRTFEDLEREGGRFVPYVPDPQNASRFRRSRKSRRARRARKPWTYFRLMWLGAGAAAVVFFDRVALILSAL
jgi:hypothetical protein